MRRVLGLLLFVCGLLGSSASPGGVPRFTASPIAWANLDAQLERAGDTAAADGGWLLRLRLRANDAAFRRVARLAAGDVGSADGYLRRARHRATLHQFALALDDLDRASRSGASLADVAAARAMVLVANGHAREVLISLRTQADARPDLASATALAHACVAAGMPQQADYWYRRALRALDTVLPFAWAELQFARGVLWSEHLGDPARGARRYRAALAALPEFVGARIHLAQIEQARGRPIPAMALLEAIGADAGDPEAPALRADLRRTLGLSGVDGDLAAARERFIELTAHYPLAYADHAARFYLGSGRDPQRAWAWAQLNLANRPTAVARSLAAAAARATGRPFAAAPPRVPSRAERAACAP